MHDSAFKEALWGFFITAAAGTALHFAYGVTGGAAILAPFVPVNESIWEHLKLLYWPTAFYTLCSLLPTGFDAHAVWARCCGLVTGLLATIILYYTYTGVIGRGFLPVDIALFYLSAALTYGLSYALRTRFPVPTAFEAGLFAAIILLVGMGMIFWTSSPPRIQLFRDPQAGTYGIAHLLRK